MIRTNKENLAGLFKSNPAIFSRIVKIGGEDLNKIKTSFMPMSIDYTETNKTERKLLAMIVIIILMIILVIVIFKIYDYYMFINFLGTKWFLIPAIVLVILGGIKLMRILVFHEKDLIRSAENMKFHQNSDLQDLWEIASIDGQKIIMYDNSVRVLVKCERGYTIGRQTKFESYHRQRFANFIGYLLNHDYTIDYYNLHVDEVNKDLIQAYEKKVSKLDNEALRDIGNAYLRKCKFIENHNIFPTWDYFLISTQNSADYDYQRVNVLNDVSTALENLIGSQYSNCKICRKADIIKFVETVFDISGVNPQKLSGKGLDNMDELLVYLKDISYYDESQVIQELEPDTEQLEDSKGDDYEDEEVNVIRGTTKYDNDDNDDDDFDSDDFDPDEEL